ncbi:hypothetical protein C1645_736477 [Glomus cerebriforme]|uniref:Uncharacterized protein n=1 Tax=Glomus cerebriforme TaxID=658196 RepID=A0A397T7I9_9GLOM|nr:hypothetical protein C1645_736477 [Glomus cerebriforme]
METHENVIAEDYDVSSIQNETKMNLNKDDKLFENHVKEFEELKVQQNEIMKVKEDSFDSEEICKKFEEMINFQSQLIDSLRARIEELEIDSLIKNQKIKQIRQDFNDIKKQIQSVQAVPVQSIKEKVFSTKNENRISNPNYEGRSSIYNIYGRTHNTHNENISQIIGLASNNNNIDQRSKLSLTYKMMNLKDALKIC